MTIGLSSSEYSSEWRKLTVKEREKGRNRKGETSQRGRAVDGMEMVMMRLRT